MSFAAEPFGVFVDDLVAGLTGAVTREEFTFVPENEPFRLGFRGDFVPDTVRVHGLVDARFHRFTRDVDYRVETDGTIHWLASQSGTAAAAARWPDPGTRFWASYERQPEGRPAPALTDRNPGSVVRTLAESFAREYAVLSRQLELVYRAGFLDSAEGRDLDQVVALVGIARRGGTFASGEVTFSRSTPAVGDVYVPAGTIVSSSEPPLITVETVDPRVLRAGTVSVAVPVQSTVAGPAGVAGASSLTVIHRPILGIESASNSQPLILGGVAETDELLRGRARRALETSGRATVGSLIGALTCVPGIRERNVRAVEDHLAAPGTLKLTIAADLDEETARRAARIIDEWRPAGIRVLHNLPIPAPPGRPPSDGGGGSDPGPLPPGQSVTGGSTAFPVGIDVLITPASSTLSAAEKTSLTRAVEGRMKQVIDERGIGDPVIYNQLVAAAMSVEGVYDVALELYRATVGTDPRGRWNLMPQPPDTRARLAALSVRVRGALIALDVAIDVQRLGLAATAEASAMLATIRDDVATRLTQFLGGAGRPARIEAPVLLGALTATADYRVASVQYVAELLQDGLRILRPNVTLSPEPEQQLWVRSVTVTEQVGS